MASVDASRLELPTGLGSHEIRALRRSELIALDAWHTTVGGDDNGRVWLPAAVRLLAPEQRLALATDDDMFFWWQLRERERCEADVGYFTNAYGSVTDEDAPGPAVPFQLWPEQVEVLQIFLEDDRVVVLKARQLGLTWLALHYGLHLILVDPDGYNAVVLGLSQDGGYAKRLLERARAINERLPSFLRGSEDRETRGSKTEFKLHERGRMVSLPGTKSAPRSWPSVDLAICDEWAFVRNNQAGPTMTALLPACRQIIAISSGNGPPEEIGWGQAFAKLYTDAATGSSDWTAVFLPTSTHPKRDDAWRAHTQDAGGYDTDEEFYAEHPETPDEALIGAGKDRYFKMQWINAAVAAGAALDALLGTPEMPPPSGEVLHLGVDWGENGVGLTIWPLEAGGVYVPPGETYGAGVEPGEQTVAIHHAAAGLQDVDPTTGRLTPPIGEARYDAAGIQSMRTFLETARARFRHQYLYNEVRSRKVPFGAKASGEAGTSKRAFKTETAQYLRRLAKRVGQGRTTGVLAISPQNVRLIRQLRALESGRGGVWTKDIDQDGPDALVAAVQRIARRHRELRADAGAPDDEE